MFISIYVVVVVVIFVWLFLCVVNDLCNPAKTTKRNEMKSNSTKIKKPLDQRQTQTHRLAIRGACVALCAVLSVLAMDGVEAVETRSSKLTATTSDVKDQATFDLHLRAQTTDGFDAPKHFGISESPIEKLSLQKITLFFNFLFAYIYV